MNFIFLAFLKRADCLHQSSPFIMSGACDGLKDAASKHQAAYD